MNRRQFLMAAMALGLIPSRAFSEIIEKTDKATPAARTLASAAKSSGILYGSPLFPSDFQNEKYMPLFRTQTSIITNTIYMSVTQPSRETWELSGFENVRRFVRNHKLKMRGHPLVWHQALPTWVNSISTADEAMKVIEERIVKLVGHFPGEFHSWDVVNEAIDGGVASAEHLTKCVWADLLGVEYLDYAFYVAHQTDPTALFTYNDWGTEDDSPGSLTKREYIFDLLKGMIGRKVPIHAVGLQSHITGGDSYKTLPDWIKRLKSLGLHVFITELDVNDDPFPSDIAERDRLVAESYSNFLNTALGTKDIDIVLNWGLADPISWLQTTPWTKRKDGLPLRPLPFGVRYEPTPAFYAMEQAFLKK